MRLSFCISSMLTPPDFKVVCVQIKVSEKCAHIKNSKSIFQYQCDMGPGNDFFLGGPSNMKNEILPILKFFAL